MQLLSSYWCEQVGGGDTVSISSEWEGQRWPPNRLDGREIGKEQNRKEKKRQVVPKSLKIWATSCAGEMEEDTVGAMIVPNRKSARSPAESTGQVEILSPSITAHSCTSRLSPTRHSPMIAPPGIKSALAVLALRCSSIGDCLMSEKDLRGHPLSLSLWKKITLILACKRQSSHVFLRF